MKLQACENCKFWDRDNKKSDFSSVRAACRKEPPRVDLDYRPVWPKTKKRDWCGEFRLGTLNQE